MMGFRFGDCIRKSVAISRGKTDVRLSKASPTETHDPIIERPANFRRLPLHIF